MPDELKPCPVCGKDMLENHRRAPPTMSGGPIRIYAKRWTCAQNDGNGGGHYVELSERCDDQPIPKEEER